MIKSTLVSLALVAGLSLSTGNAHAAVPAPSISQTGMVEKAGVEHCFWKLKKNGKLKPKCKD
jgi:hypothetical protein